MAFLENKFVYKALRKATGSPKFFYLEDDFGTINRHFRKNTRCLN